LKELRVLDGWEEARALFDEEKLRKVIVISESEKTTLLEEISWRQKLRDQWLKEGGKSMKFFHWPTQIGETNPFSQC
jgi:hypothetical protein